MQKPTQNNLIWVFWVQLIFILLLVMEILCVLVPMSAFDSSVLWKIVKYIEQAGSSVLVFGSIPAGVIGLIFAKRLEKLRIATKAMAIINIIVGVVFLGLIAVVLVGAVMGEIHV